MKKFFSIIGLFCLAGPLTVQIMAQAASVHMRPSYVDISQASSKGAILLKLTGYPTNDVRYRLYNGSTQYTCWDESGRCFVTSSAYASGPPVPGAPSSAALFWIPYLRGSNNSTNATYRDRLGPDYTTNYRDAALPAATAISNSFKLDGSLLEGTGYPLTSKYIILAFSNGDFVAASHSDTTTGLFSIVCPDGLSVDRVEVRSLGDDLVGVRHGTWPVSESLGAVQLTLISRVELNRYPVDNVGKGLFRVFPVPAGDILYVEGELPISGVELYDLSGSVVTRLVTNRSIKATLTMSGLPPGIYTLRIVYKGGQQFVKVIKGE
jgi:hypothetical protein